MAIYHLSVKVIQRSKGRSATAAAAYRAGELIACEREGRDHDYTLKSGVAHSQIIGWDGSREELWNAAEAAERQKNAQTAKEYELALPVELTREAQIALSERFGQWLHERHGVAVDIACHDLNSNNPHAHIMTTTRPVQDGALAPVKAEVEWSDKKRKQHGLPGRKTELDAARQQWAEIANAALAESGVKARIDHRSLKEQGIDRPPQVHEGPTVRKIEAKAQRRAEQAGARYKPVTIKGQMNDDARQIAKIQLDLDAMRAEREREAEAERQQAREAAQAANQAEARAEARDAAESAHSAAHAVYLSPPVLEAAADYRRAHNPADKARLANRVADVIEQRIPERPQLPPLDEVRSDARAKVPVKIKQRDGRVIETTVGEVGDWGDQAEKARDRAEREFKAAAAARSWWRPKTWSRERSARRKLDQCQQEVERAHRRLIAVEKGLLQPGPQDRVIQRVGAVMSSLRDQQRSFDRRWSGHTGESAAWRETAREHESEQREREHESEQRERQRQQQRMEPGPRQGPKKDSDLGL